MSKGFWIAISVLIIVVVGFWGLGSTYQSSRVSTNDTKAEISLTDEQRQTITLAVASNYNYTGNEAKIDDAMQALHNHSESSVAQMNQFIIDEYKKSQVELEKLARKGDYQAQRNLAFGHATDPEMAGADRTQGCAWYLVLYNSGSPKVVDDLDLANVEIYCEKALNDKQKRAAEIKANLLLKAIYNKDSNVKVDEYLNNYL